MHFEQHVLCHHSGCRNRHLSKRSERRRQRYRCLAHSEITSLLSVCKRSTHPFLHSFVKLLLLTGARKSELRRAKWTCIDLQKGELFVAVSKSGRSRTVVLSKKALAALEQMKLRSKALGLPITRDSWVFANPRTGQL